MPSYQALDRVADLHNPLLGAMWIALIISSLLRRRRRQAIARAGIGAACLLAAYALMWLDGALGVWSRAGLDYSTHTAVGAALVAALLSISNRVGVLAAALFSLYVPLMLYQGYHTVADIASTALAVAAPAFSMAYRARRGPRSFSDGRRCGRADRS